MTDETDSPPPPDSSLPHGANAAGTWEGLRVTATQAMAWGVDVCGRLAQLHEAGVYVGDISAATIRQGPDGQPILPLPDPEATGPNWEEVGALAAALQTITVDPPARFREALRPPYASAEALGRELQDAQRDLGLDVTVLPFEPHAHTSIPPMEIPPEAIELTSIRDLLDGDDVDAPVVAEAPHERAPSSWDASETGMPTTVTGDGSSDGDGIVADDAGPAGSDAAPATGDAHSDGGDLVTNGAPVIGEDAGGSMGDGAVTGATAAEGPHDPAGPGGGDATGAADRGTSGADSSGAGSGGVRSDEADSDAVPRTAGPNPWVLLAVAIIVFVVAVAVGVGWR